MRITGGEVAGLAAGAGLLFLLAGGGQWLTEGQPKTQAVRLQGQLWGAQKRPQARSSAKHGKLAPRRSVSRRTPAARRPPARRVRFKPTTGPARRLYKPSRYAHRNGAVRMLGRMAPALRVARWSAGDRKPPSIPKLRGKLVYLYAFQSW